MQLNFGMIATSGGELPVSLSEKQNPDQGDLFHQVLTEATVVDESASQPLDDENAVAESKLVSQAIAPAPEAQDPEAILPQGPIQVPSTFAGENSVQEAPALPSPVVVAEETAATWQSAVDLDGGEARFGPSSPLSDPGQSPVNPEQEQPALPGEFAVKARATSKTSTGPAEAAAGKPVESTQEAETQPVLPQTTAPADKNQVAPSTETGAGVEQTITAKPAAVQPTRDEQLPAAPVTQESGPRPLPESQKSGETSPAPEEAVRAATVDVPAQAAVTKNDNPVATDAATETVDSLPQENPGFTGGDLHQEQPDSSPREQQFAARLTTPAAAEGAPTPSVEADFSIKTTETSPQPETATDKQIAADELVKQVRLNIRTGSSRINFLVDPPELGRLDIQLVVKNGRLTGHITAESNAVQEALVDGLRSLKETMREAGIHVDSLEVKSNEQNAASHEQSSAPDEGRGAWSQSRRSRPSGNDNEAVPSHESAESKMEGEVVADGSLNVIA